MSQLYHNDMYDFNNPVKSYWEYSIDNNSSNFKELKKDIITNILVVGAGYTGISCALQLAKKYNEDENE